MSMATALLFIVYEEYRNEKWYKNGNDKNGIKTYDRHQARNFSYKSRSGINASRNDRHKLKSYFESVSDHLIRAIYVFARKCSAGYLHLKHIERHKMFRWGGTGGLWRSFVFTVKNARRCCHLASVIAARSAQLISFFTGLRLTLSLHDYSCNVLPRVDYVYKTLANNHKRLLQRNRECIPGMWSRTLGLDVSVSRPSLDVLTSRLGLVSD